MERGEKRGENIINRYNLSLRDLLGGTRILAKEEDGDV